MEDSSLEHPGLAGEYLRSLQDQVDALHERNERLKARVTRLEVERDRLREQSGRRRRRTSRPAARQHAEPGKDSSVSIPGVGTIPDLALPNGPVSRPGLKVAGVLDEFSRAAFRYEFDLVNVPGVDWEPVLEEHQPDLLLVESAYGGIEGSWAGKVARFGAPSASLSKLVTWCNEHRIPTVFWNKEDPINFDWFIASASMFGFVFTVDSNMVGTYERKLDTARIGVLPFAAQPVIHYPPEADTRPGHLAFAGAYYGAKHPERREQMQMLLSPALELDLHIFDRMDRQSDPRFAWPEEYVSHIVGSLTYPQTIEVYRRYRTFINVNTVTTSPTMCARRVYELLACGTRVVSGPSAALSGVPVTVVDSLEAARSALSDDADHDPRAGYEWIQAGNLVSDRVDAVLEGIH